MHLTIVIIIVTYEFVKIGCQVARADPFPFPFCKCFLFSCFVLVYGHIVCLFHILICIMHSAFNLLVFPNSMFTALLFFIYEGAMCSPAK